MKRALFTSKNLIGDALNISPALNAWYKANPEWVVTILTSDDAASELYPHMGVPLDGFTTELFDFYHDFDVSRAFQIGEERKCHIAMAYHLDLVSACYSSILVGDMFAPEPLENLKPTFIPVEEEHESDLILISPFSRSCSVHTMGVPNKTLPWHKWEHIIEFLRTLGRIGVIGAEGDRTPLEISEDEYYTGLSLNKVALMLRDCKVLVTIDNGMSHLGASQSAPTVLFYPACLGEHWILPVGNPNASAIHVDPHKVAPGILLRQVKEVIYRTLRES